MDKRTSTIKFSEYNFLRLYCAIKITKDEISIINNHELETDLYKYYDNLEFKILFEDICKKEDSINPKDSYLDISVAFQTAYAFGLLNILQNNDSLKSTINITKEEAKNIIEEFSVSYVNKMDYLINQINCDKKINNMEKEELSNFQKGLKQLNAPYKKTEAYKIFVESQRHNKPNNASMFWNTDIGYVDKYQDVKMNNDGPVKKKLNDLNILEKLV